MLLAPIQVQTARRLATPLRWAMTTCTASPRRGDVNYRTEETPGEDANVKNSHAYEYDANGNLIYVNTSREKKDGESDEKAGERKLRWDEENRLLSSDDNGFVTN